MAQPQTEAEFQCLLATMRETTEGLDPDATRGVIATLNLVTWMGEHTPYLIARIDHLQAVADAADTALTQIVAHPEGCRAALLTLHRALERLKETQ
jgi:hypothetical protein